MTVTSAAPYKELAAGLRGSLIMPGDPGYDEARAVYNAMIDKRPAAIARCRDTADVISCVRFAREHGATAIEGHPVDVAALSAARVGGSGIFTGTVAMFSAAGFTEVARTYPTRPVMRLLL